MTHSLSLLLLLLLCLFFFFFFLSFFLAFIFSVSSLHLIIHLIYVFRGYLAPEYALLGQLTKKADVYSFGVLMLEIISGRSSSKAAFGEELLVLVEWVNFSSLIPQFH